MPAFLCSIAFQCLSVSLPAAFRSDHPRNQSRWPKQWHFGIGQQVFPSIPVEINPQQQINDLCHPSPRGDQTISATARKQKIKFRQNRGQECRERETHAWLKTPPTPNRRIPSYKNSRGQVVLQDQGILPLSGLPLGIIHWDANSRLSWRSPINFLFCSPKLDLVTGEWIRFQMMAKVQSGYSFKINYFSLESTSLELFIIIWQLYFNLTAILKWFSQYK